MDYTAYIILGAFALDLCLGDPRGFPHLIVGYGRVIAYGDRYLNRGKYRAAWGVVLVVCLVGGAYGLGYGAMLLSIGLGGVWVWTAFGTVLLFYCLSNRSLITAGYRVFEALRHDDLPLARKAVSEMVGRDVSHLNAQQVRQAALESMAENLSDGVIAPLFYAMFFGVPGAMAYKMINTLDAMIGYMSPQYRVFGYFAAKVDDVANYVPARLTALLMLVVWGKLGGLGFVWRMGRRHLSPNAGWPQAALAYLLDCQFGGPHSYHGQRIAKPYIGDHNRTLPHDAVRIAAGVNMATSMVFCMMVWGHVYVWG